MWGDGYTDDIKPRRLSIIRRKIRADIWKGLEQDEQDGVWRHKILFKIRYKVPCNDRDFRKEDMRVLESKYLTKSIENHLHLKMTLYRFQLKTWISIDEHMNNYMKLLPDLLIVDVVIEDEGKVLILLNSLPDEDYETFILTLINGKQSLVYNEVSFMN